MILLGAVAIPLDVVLRIHYKLQDFHLFTSRCIFISSRKDNLVFDQKTKSFIVCASQHKVHLYVPFENELPSAMPAFYN